MFCSKCGAEISSRAKFCPLCGAPQDQNNNSDHIDPESDTVYFGGTDPSMPPSGEEDTVFMGVPPRDNGVPSSEQDTVFMGAQRQSNTDAFAQVKIPGVQKPFPEKKRRNSYESSNIGISTPKKVMIIVGLVIIAVLAVYLVFDFMTV